MGADVKKKDDFWISFYSHKTHMTDPVPGCLMLGYGFGGNQSISSSIYLRSAFANFVWLKIYVFKCFNLLTMTML